MSFLDREIIKRGYKTNLSGTRYVREAVRIILDRPGPQRIQMTKELYPTIAKAANVDWRCVERSMRFAVKEAQPGRTVSQEVHDLAAVVRAYED